MKQILIVFQILIASIALADTPTPTPTNTPFAAVDRSNKVNALQSSLVTVAATAVPTAYGTSFVANTLQHPLQLVEMVNDLDCGITISVNGGTNDHFYIPAKTTLSLPLGAYGMKGKYIISGKSAAACSSGSFYISSVF